MKSNIFNSIRNSYISQYKLLNKKYTISFKEYNNKRMFLNNTFYTVYKFNFCNNNFDNNIPSQKSTFERYIKKIKAFFNKRTFVFRLMFYASFILIAISFMRLSNNINYSKNITPVFFLENEINNENAFYNVAGVVKPGSINLIKGTDEISFILTDYEHEIQVFYKGTVSNLQEGNTAIVTGCLINKNKPDSLMSSKIVTDHSYNSSVWISKIIINK